MTQVNPLSQLYFPFTIGGLVYIYIYTYVYVYLLYSYIWFTLLTRIAMCFACTEHRVQVCLRVARCGCCRIDELLNRYTISYSYIYIV